MTSEKLFRALRKCAAYIRRPHGNETNEKGERCHGKGHLHIMEALLKRDGIPQTQLADVLCIRPQSLSEALLTLENRGWIRRVAGECDKRMLLIYLTDTGKECCEYLTEERRARAEDFFGALNDAEQTELLALLKKLIDARERKESVKKNEKEKCKCHHAECTTNTNESPCQPE